MYYMLTLPSEELKQLISDLNNIIIIINVRLVEPYTEKIAWIPEATEEQGNHWTCVNIPLKGDAELVYADSLGYPIPTNIDFYFRNLLSVISPSISIQKDSILAHNHDSSSICSRTFDCLELPFQGPTGNICGLATLAASTIFARGTKVSRNHRSWVNSLRFDSHQKYLRVFFIDCFMKKEMKSLFVPEEKKLVSEVPTHKKKLVRDTSVEKKKLASEVPTNKKKLVSDTSVEKKKLVSEVPTNKKKFVSDTSVEKKKLVSEVPTNKKKLVSDTSLEEEKLVSEVPTNKKKFVPEVQDTNDCIVNGGHFIKILNVVEEGRER
jgi:hypothetical protein